MHPRAHGLACAMIWRGSFTPLSYLYENNFTYQTHTRTHTSYVHTIRTHQTHAYIYIYIYLFIYLFIFTFIRLRADSAVALCEFAAAGDPVNTLAFASGGVFLAGYVDHCVSARVCLVCVPMACVSTMSRCVVVSVILCVSFSRLLLLLPLPSLSSSSSCCCCHSFLLVHAHHPLVWRGECRYLSGKVRGFHAHTKQKLFEIDAHTRPIMAMDIW
jgi:hypothetical protein